MRELLKELKRTTEKQHEIMDLIREEGRMMDFYQDLDTIRRIKGYTELILELEVKRELLTTVIAKSVSCPDY
jgi:hypothetical protein